MEKKQTPPKPSVKPEIPKQLPKAVPKGNGMPKLEKPSSPPPKKKN